VAAPELLPASAAAGQSFHNRRTANEVLKSQKRRLRLDERRGQLVDKRRALVLVRRLAEEDCDAVLAWPTRATGPHGGAAPNILHQDRNGTTPSRRCAGTQDHERRNAPRMIDKFVRSMAEAMNGIRDGSTVLMAGFGEVGAPHALLDGLIEQGATDLTIVVNSAGRVHAPGKPSEGVARLIELRRVRKVITSFIRSQSLAGEAVREGRMEAEVVPQGTLAERIRAAGAGVPAFFTPTGAGTLVAEGKEEREYGGPPLRAGTRPAGRCRPRRGLDGGSLGQPDLQGQRTKFNPIMAMAGELTIVQAHHVCDLGQLSANEIVTPGIFVDRVLHVAAGDPRLPR
jgi:3-oxoadipate CoA-transferase alpha subunit